MWGERHGCGEVTFSNGDVYRGEFDQDRRHGRGRFFSKDLNENSATIWEKDTETGQPCDMSDVTPRVAQGQ